MTTVAAKSLAQQFATEYAAGVVPALLKAIKYVKIGSRVLLAVTVLGTYTHQRDFLSTQGLGLCAWLFPASIDLGIVLLMIVTQTKAIHAQTKSRAMKALVVLFAMSMTINALAPGRPIAHVASPLMVLVAALIEWVSSSIRPDFAALESAETEAQAAVTVTPRRTMSEESKAKAAATRAANAKAKADAEEARRERRRLARMVRDAERRNDIELAWAGPTAPVSPAPADWRSDGSYM